MVSDAFNGNQGKPWSGFGAIMPLSLVVISRWKRLVSVNLPFVGLVFGTGELGAVFCNRTAALK
jgi:hypothetical protein